MHRQMMYSLASKGKRGPALKHFEVCRTVLESEFQVTPEEKTVQLFEHIRDGLDITSYNEFPAPDVSQTITISSTVSHRQTLPIQTMPFVGRQTELDNLSQMINDGCRLLTLIGRGGIGKTRLAIELADHLTAAFGDDVYFVPLTAVAKADEIPQAIAKSVGYTFTPGTDITEQLLQFFAEKRCLLVLDNFEHLIGGTSLLNTFLKRIAGYCRIKNSNQSKS